MGYHRIHTCCGAKPTAFRRPPKGGCFALSCPSLLPAPHRLTIIEGGPDTNSEEEAGGEGREEGEEVEGDARRPASMSRSKGTPPNT